MKIHFTAIGGSAMHNLAIALYKKGETVSGSDDEIFEPSKSRLKRYNLLPDDQQWHPEKITKDLDAVILGMHAREDNPELLRAQQLGIPIYSYPEYLYEQTRNKKRVVIGGSHGKTTITSMILHVLRFYQIKFDFMVGSLLEGFDTMVELSNDAKIAIFEGDEYLSSPIDRRPKFHLYKPHLALLSGIAWDHINVFPTFEIYIEQFRKFIDLVEPDGAIVYCRADHLLQKLIQDTPENVEAIAYDLPDYEIINGQTFVYNGSKSVPLKIFGEHNLLNLNGARFICNELGIDDDKFFKAIQSFQGASKRLQLLAKNEYTNVYLDFAHSPSKLLATTRAVKKQFPERKLVACMELHTYSSLNKDFLEQYHNTMSDAAIAIVYFNPKTLAHKKLPTISSQMVMESFGRDDLQVMTSADHVSDLLESMDWNDKNLLFMTSGNFSGVPLNEFAKKIVEK